MASTHNETTRDAACSASWFENENGDLMAHIEDSIRSGEIGKTRIAYAASMNEETVCSAHVMHILVTESFEIGKISRNVGDVYCKPQYKFYELWDEGEGTPTCPQCIRIAQRLEKASSKAK